LLIERADGGISVMALAPGADPAVELARWAEHADPSWLPVARSVAADNPTLPPRRWRAAWRRVGQGIGVPLPAARQLRKRELLALAADRLPQLRDRIDAAEDAAEDAGDSNLLTQLRQRRAALRALDVDAALAELADLNSVDKYLPALLVQVD
jgi:hypothetical protein